MCAQCPWKRVYCQGKDRKGKQIVHVNSQGGTYTLILCETLYLGELNGYLIGI
jgi:hypothetical protein